MGTDYLWCEPWGHFLEHCTYNSISTSWRARKGLATLSVTSHTLALYLFFWQLKSQFSKWQFLAFSRVKWSVLHESVLACSAILLTWIPKETFFGSPTIQSSLQSGPGAKHVIITSGNTETELYALRKEPTNKDNFTSVLLYLQEYNVQETWKVV